MSQGSSLWRSILVSPPRPRRHHELSFGRGVPVGWLWLHQSGHELLPFDSLLAQFGLRRSRCATCKLPCDFEQVLLEVLVCSQGISGCTRAAVDPPSRSSYASDSMEIMRVQRVCEAHLRVVLLELVPL